MEFKKLLQAMDSCVRCGGSCDSCPYGDSDSDTKIVCASLLFDVKKALENTTNALRTEDASLLFDAKKALENTTNALRTEDTSLSVIKLGESYEIEFENNKDFRYRNQDIVTIGLKFSKEPRSVALKCIDIRVTCSHIFFTDSKTKTRYSFSKCDAVKNTWFCLDIYNA